MSYIKESLNDEEKIISIFPYHWIIWIKNILPTLIRVSLFIGFFSIMLPKLPALLTPLKAYIYWIVILILIITIISKILHILGLEQGITNKRMIMKTGFFSRKTDEMIISKVETVEINQSAIGRVFGFGNVIITGTGNSNIVFKEIKNPIEIKKIIDNTIKNN